jgi:flagellar biosynthetic protein FliQ
LNETDALDILQYAIWTVILASSPGVAAAMAIGVVIAVLQALTQVQEITLTFVPKIMGIFVAVVLSAYFMGATIAGFATFAFSRIETGF